MSAVTRLGLYGAARKPYGSFAGKSPSAGGSKVYTKTFTRQGLYSGPRIPYGSFAGKSPSAGGSKVYTKTFTRQGLYSGPRMPYGSFAGKTATVTVIPTPSGGRSRRKRKYLVEFEDQHYIFNTVAEVENFLQTVRETVTEAAEDHPEVIEKKPRLRVRTGSGKPTQSKVVKEELKKTRKVIDLAAEKARRERERQRDLDKQISEALQAKLKDEDETILALIL